MTARPQKGGLTTSQTSSLIGMVKFVITSRQRSGSIFLGSVLSSHPHIHCYGEVLHGRNRESKLDFFYRFWLDRVRANGAHITYRGMVKTFELFLSQIYSSQSGKQAVGIDIKYDQYVHIPNIFVILKKQDAKIIHLIRRNILKTLTSKRLNDRKKELGRRAHGTAQVPPAQVSFTDLEGMIRQLERRSLEIETQRRILSSQFDYLEVFYEDFFDAPTDESQTIVPSILDRMYAFLNITDHRYDLKTDLRKTNPSKLSELITNYDQVASRLRGSPWEKFLDQPDG